MKKKVGLGLALMIIFSIISISPLKALDSDDTSGLTTVDKDGNVVSLDSEVPQTIVTYQPTVNKKARSSYAVSTDDYVVGSYDNSVFTPVSTFSTYESASALLQETAGNAELLIVKNALALAVTDGIVNFKTKSSSSINTYFTYDSDGSTGYTNGYYGADALYLGTSSDGTKIKFMLSGAIGWVAAADVNVIAANDSQLKSRNYYSVSGGNLSHYITTDVTLSNYSELFLGTAPSYLNTNTTYYSYDGHYFYTNFSAMKNDVNAGTHSAAVNPNNPYYNYYQYLPQRSVTSYSVDQLNTYINSKAINVATSKMYNTASYFVAAQNTYGVNALTMIALAGNESNWGKSNIAMTKNNLFGHAAYDSCTSCAQFYASVSESINYHANDYVSQGYADSTDSRYEGSYLGDKSSGMNVRYASDPYWGEKAGIIAMAASRYLSSTTDVNKYTLGVDESSGQWNVRKESSTSSSALYLTPAMYNNVFIILDKVSGQTVSGSATWYKIQTDPVLKADRSGVNTSTGVYNFANNYAYLHSGSVTKIIQGTTEVGVPVVQYSAHVQNIGWQENVTNSAVAGTTGSNLGIEALHVGITNVSSSFTINAKIHVKDIGWVSYDAINDNTVLGTTGINKQIQAVQFDVTGLTGYKLQYRVHVQNIGWMNWQDEGQLAGTTGLNLQIEAIQLRVVADSTNAEPTISYMAHVQNIGWQNWQADSGIAGTTGMGLGIEALKISMDHITANTSISGSVHVQNIGWVDMSSVQEQKIFGTVGQHLTVEAIKLQLNGLPGYKLQYRVHVQNIGWMDWTDQGTQAGTTGKNLWLEAIQIRVVKAN